MNIDITVNMWHIEQIYKGMRESISKVEGHIKEYEKDLEDDRMSERGKEHSQHMIEHYTTYIEEKREALKDFMQRAVDGGFPAVEWLYEELNLTRPKAKE